jgi:hypothetical protein
MTFHVDGTDYKADPGSFVSLPRGLPHTFTIESPSCRYLVMNTPGGFERMFELRPKTVEAPLPRSPTTGSRSSAPPARGRPRIAIAHGSVAIQRCVGLIGIRV